MNKRFSKKDVVVNDDGTIDFNDFYIEVPDHYSDRWGFYIKGCAVPDDSKLGYDMSDLEYYEHPKGKYEYMHGIPGYDYLDTIDVVNEYIIDELYGMHKIGTINRSKKGKNKLSSELVKIAKNLIDEDGELKTKELKLSGGVDRTMNFISALKDVIADLNNINEQRIEDFVDYAKILEKGLYSDKYNLTAVAEKFEKDFMKLKYDMRIWMDKIKRQLASQQLSELIYNKFKNK